MILRLESSGAFYLPICCLGWDDLKAGLTRGCHLGHLHLAFLLQLGEQVPRERASRQRTIQKYQGKLHGPFWLNFRSHKVVTFATSYLYKWVTKARFKGWGIRLTSWWQSATSHCRRACGTGGTVEVSLENAVSQSLVGWEGLSTFQPGIGQFGPCY